MSPKKNVEQAFREQVALLQQEQPQTPEYLVPKIVKDMGQLIGLEADARLGNWDISQLEPETLDAYRELAATTSRLLDLFSVEKVSEEAVASVSHRLAASVDPLVSLHSRVDHLFRSYQQDEADHVRDDAQKLWAALVFRCHSITGKSIDTVLKQY